MPVKRYVQLSLACLMLLICSLDTFAQQSQQSFSEWLNDRIDQVKKEKARMLTNQSDPSKQVETPNMSGNSTSIVNHATAADLVGISIIPGDISGGTQDQKPPTSLSFTVSTYALFSALRGEDPFNPTFYNKNKGLRRLSFTLGYDTNDKKKKSNGTEVTRSAEIFGVKLLVYDGRDKTVTKQISVLSSNLTSAAINFGMISEDVVNFLRTNQKLKEVNISLVTNFDQEVKKFLSKEDLEEIDRIIEKRIKSFVTLTEGTENALNEVRRAGQLSFNFLVRRRNPGADDYMIEGIFEKGLSNSLNLAANSAFIYTNRKLIGGDRRGGRAAVELTYRLTKDNISGTGPVSLSFAGDAKWMQGIDGIYTVQTKLNFPIYEGVDLPISFTVANRTENIKERVVTGRFGFTFDIAKLAQKFKK